MRIGILILVGCCVWITTAEAEQTITAYYERKFLIRDMQIELNKKSCAKAEHSYQGWDVQRVCPALKKNSTERELALYELCIADLSDDQKTVEAWNAWVITCTTRTYPQVIRERNQRIESGKVERSKPEPPRTKEVPLPIRKKRTKGRRSRQ